MNLQQIKSRITAARSIGLDFVDTTPPEVQSALMDLASISEHLLGQRGMAPLMSARERGMLHLVSQTGAMEYEVRSSWWAVHAPAWISTPVATWFAWKVRRKYRRYLSLMIKSSESKP